MKHHNLTPAWLDDATYQEIADLGPAGISGLQEQVDADKKLAEARAQALHNALVWLYGERYLAELAAKGGVGTAHLDDGEFDVAVNVPKKVEWDQGKLCAILDSLPEDVAKHYAKVKVEVEEVKYKAAPPDIQAKLQPARTVKPGKPKFTFARREQEAA